LGRGRKWSLGAERRVVLRAQLLRDAVAVLELQWYRMTDAGHPYFWHAPTGATTWNEPGGSVWRECAAPELGGRQVFVWDGVAVQGG